MKSGERLGAWGLGSDWMEITNLAGRAVGYEDRSFILSIQDTQ